MNAQELRVFQRKLRALNDGPNKVIDLAKAQEREVPLTALEKARPAVGPGRPDRLKELTDLEFVVWAMGQLSANGVRQMSNCALGRVLKVSEGRIRQVRESALMKMEGE